MDPSRFVLLSCFMVIGNTVAVVLTAEIFRKFRHQRDGLLFSSILLGVVSGVEIIAALIAFVKLAPGSAGINVASLTSWIWTSAAVFVSALLIYHEWDKSNPNPRPRDWDEYFDRLEDSRRPLEVRARMIHEEDTPLPLG